MLTATTSALVVSLRQLEMNFTFFTDPPPRAPTQAEFDSVAVITADFIENFYTDRFSSDPTTLFVGSTTTSEVTSTFNPVQLTFVFSLSFLRTGNIPSRGEVESFTINELQSNAPFINAVSLAEPADNIFRDVMRIEFAYRMFT